MTDTTEYFCTFCNQFQYNMDILMACRSCGEYKGIIKVSTQEDINE